MDFQSVIVALILTLAGVFAVFKIRQKLNALTAKKSSNCEIGCGLCKTEKGRKFF